MFWKYGAARKVGVRKSLSTVQWRAATFVVPVRDTFVTSDCEKSVFLGCYAARSVNSRPTFQDNL